MKPPCHRGRLLAAWQRRGPGGTVDLGGPDAPASYAGTILPLELLVHGRDVTTATGRKLPVADRAPAMSRRVAFTGRPLSWGERG